MYVPEKHRVVLGPQHNCKFSATNQSIHFATRNDVMTIVVDAWSGEVTRKSACEAVDWLIPDIIRAHFLGSWQSLRLATQPKNSWFPPHT